MNRFVWLRWLILVGAASAAFPDAARAQYLRIRDICRVKGQESNTLVGVGFVMGLKGTGDGDPSVLISLASSLEAMGTPLGRPGDTKAIMDKLKNVKNAAFVYVHANVPPEGARQGEQLSCVVHSPWGAKSLEGGYLQMTTLRGPRRDDPNVYATAQGPVMLQPTGSPNTGTIHDGCRLETDFTYSFVDESHVTLVIDSNHASFPVADAIEKAINEGGQRDNGKGSSAFWGEIAKALDPVNIRVRVPVEYEGHLVDFIATLLDTQIAIQSPEARVVINERTGVIIVGEKVMVGPIAVTRRNYSVQVGQNPAEGPLMIVDPSQNTSTTRLRSLVDALNGLKASPQEIIDIIKSLESSGQLYGRLVVE